MNRESKIMDFRHANKPKDVKPEDAESEEISKYREEHNLGPFANDEMIKQLIISEKGGPIFAQEDWDKPLDPKDSTKLTYEGIRRSHELADEIFKQIESSPRGRICIFASSPVGRTVETMAVIKDRINYLLNREQPKNLKSLELESLDSTIASEDMPSDSSYFIFNQKPVEKIGPISNNITQEKVNKAMGETAGEMLWFARPEEIKELKNELKKLFPKVDPDFIDQIMPEDYQNPPETRVMEIITYYEQLLDFVDKNFPNKPVDIYNISHNMVLDATTIRLLGLDISADSVRKLGSEAREYLERSVMSIKDNKLTIKFRDFQNTLSLDDFKKLYNKLQKEADQRREQWGLQL